MGKKRALITGISGQDGSYMAEYLLERNYEVHGMVRRASLENPAPFLWRIKNILSQIELHHAQLESYPSLYTLLKKIVPHECYHFAAQSFVSYSFEEEASTMVTNVNGTHHLLSSLLHLAPECRFYFAGTSEMFGDVQESPQNEGTRFRPRSIYGITKLVGHELVRNYREQHNLFGVTGILYNHESPRRGMEFVTRKITHTAAQIKLGMANELRLGNVDAKRDWGYALNYVEAMFKMVNNTEPEDFVIGSGVLHSVREFLELTFSYLGLNYRDYLVIDEKFFRPTGQTPLVANISKAQEKLSWKPSLNFENLVEMMVRSDYDALKKSA